jgi:uncharacterized protein (TIGR00725 family)
MRRRLIGVSGPGTCVPEIEELAAEVGREIARRGGIVVCGGRGGVMAAAARGASESGGLTIGILPGPDARDANPYIDLPIPTGMGQARNSIIAHTSEVLIAVAGGYGTLSEIALALKVGKGVVVLNPLIHVPGTHEAGTPADAVEQAWHLLP